MSVTIRHKIQVQHSITCLALSAVDCGDWDTPWAYLERVTSRRKNGANIGPRESGERWWWARCSDPDCPAEIVVSENDMLAALEEGAKDE